MKLINLIVQIFNLRWADKVFVNTFNEYYRFSSFISAVFHYCVVIDEVQKVYNENAKFALWANNSQAYIATYIALILKNVDFYLIPPEMSIQSVRAIVSNSNINFMFTGDNVKELELIHSMQPIPFFKGVYNISTNSFTYVKSLSIEDRGRLLDIIKLSEKIELVYNGTYKPDELEEVLSHGFKVKKRDRKIGVFSSGSESTYPHVVYFDDELIYNGLLKLIDSELLPSIKHKVVYSNISFATAPIWTILWPLYEGAYFSFSRQEAEVCIENTSTFEQQWQQISKEVYEIRFLGKWLLKSSLFWLFRFIARYKLKKYFNFETKKSAIIVMNAFLSPRILKTVVGYLPIYTTYGLQECNQIVAVNNFSTKGHLTENCVGELFDGLYGSIREISVQSGEGTLLLSGDHFSDDTDFEGVSYDTRDHASAHTDSGKFLFFVYGKARYAIKDSYYKGSNYENLERILKNVPYFKDVLLFDYNGDVHILIYPDKDVVEANNFGLLDFKNFIKSYKFLLNDQFGNDFIKDVKIMFTDFLRTHDGKIKKAWYFITIADEVQD